MLEIRAGYCHAAKGFHSLHPMTYISCSLQVFEFTMLFKGVTTEVVTRDSSQALTDNGQADKTVGPGSEGRELNCLPINFSFDSLQTVTVPLLEYCTFILL